MADEFFSFDEALDKLRLKEEELKRLVSEGEIRAFRQGDTMKLRVSDVETLRAELSGGEIVDLGEATEDLVFEDETDLDDAMATQEIADVDTIIEEDVEELEIEESAARPAVRRQSAIASAREEEETEGTPMLVAAVASAIVLVLGIPVLHALTTGLVTGPAKSIAGALSGAFGGPPLD